MSVVVSRPIVATAFLLAATMARAQGAPTISGTVIDPAKNPLPATQVSVRGTRLGAATDEAGRFRITLTGVTDSVVTLDVRRIGRVSVSRTARPGESDIVVTLVESAVSLDQVVVTGQPGATEKRALPTSISTVDAQQVLESSAPPDFQTLLNGRVPNAVILNNSGMIGAGTTVNIRGYATFSLSNQPLIYVDGVRVDNDQGTGPTNQAFGASTTTRWNDIDPDDIDHVEVIKGPAATTIYGTEASHGVLQIFTRAGTQGKATWNFTTRQGFNQFVNPGGRLWTNYDVVSNGDTVGINQYDFYTGQGHQLFQEGWNQSYNLSVGGGTPNVRYYVSGNFKKDDGVTKPNNQYTASPRAQVTYSPSEKFSVATNLGYVTGRTNLEYEAGGGGTTWTTYYADPANLGTPRDGFYTAPPQAYYDQYTIFQTFSRVTGGVDITHRPTDWFTHHLTFGVDQAYENGTELSPRNADPNHSFFFGTDADSGFVNLTNRRTTLNTFTYNATGRFSIPGLHLTAATTAGADAYLRQTEVTLQSRSDFAFPGLRSISSATSGSVTETDSTAPDNTIGFFAQEELSWNNRLFLTGGFRVDDNSAFGSKFNRVYYPKIGGSWVVSEEPFFPKTPAVSSLRLRAAYGESGQAPVPFSSVASFQSTTGPGGIASVTPLSVGNTTLGPEKSYETELGFDASFLHDRAGIEYTYYMGGTRDAILELPAAPSTGYPGDRFVNAGTLWKNGYELTLRGSPIQRKGLGLDLNFTISHNDAVVRNIGGNTALNPSQYIYDIVGYPVNSWFGKKITSATMDASGNPTNVMCDGGPHHAPVSCDVAPNVLLGRTSPDLEGSFSPTLRVAPGFTFNALFDFKRGYYKMNGNQRVRCHLFDLCRENWYPTQYPAAQIAADNMGSSYYGDLVQNASFTKLRVLSVSYAPPIWVASRLGASHLSLTFAAQNLFTWTHYPGLDPEGSFQGADRGLGQWEQAILPQLRQFVWVVNLTY
ncbi:MAG TPA: SusC/RagA family TonB-linked outer membrane protein [Gemmatimonadaceae bacterium]|nr:SusC/RagA family TonB-linked outer membrane protein [Gemmatimonadaceae bacterium]